MKRVIYLLLALFTHAQADTIDHYMNIANNIPQMEMKADPQSQAWARSARNILTLTSDCIAESFLLANETASAQGFPLFCLPNGETLKAEKLNELIQQAYRDLAKQGTEKNRMTVSQVALVALKKQYPCKESTAQSPFGRPNGDKTQSLEHQSSLKLLSP